MKTQNPINFVLFVALCVLSGVLFVIEYNTRYLDAVRQGISYFTNPIGYVAQLPQTLIASASGYFQKHDALTEKIDSLNRQLLEMQGVAQQYSALEHRYKQLEQVLAVPVSLDFEMQLVEVVRLIQDVDRQEAIINVGRTDGVAKDMVVLAPNGIFGRILEVHDHTSNVITIFDKRHALPVVDKRSGIRSIAAGNGRNDDLSLENVHRRSDIQLDDEILSSGIGKVFPAGFPVGTVTRTEDIPTESLLRVDVRPNANIDSDRFVYVILGPKQSE